MTNLAKIGLIFLVLFSVSCRKTIHNEDSQILDPSEPHETETLCRKDIPVCYDKTHHEEAFTVSLFRGRIAVDGRKGDLIRCWMKGPND